MKWTEKAIVTKPTGKRSSRKLEGKVAIILSQKINASYILPGNSFLFCLHWWSSSAKILCEIHIPALLVLPTLKVPVKKTIVQKNIKKVDLFGTCYNEEDESLVCCLLPLLLQCMLSLCRHVPVEHRQSPVCCPHHCNLVLQRQSCSACITCSSTTCLHPHYVSSGQFCWGFFLYVLGEEHRRNWLNVCDVVRGSKPISYFTYLKWFLASCQQKHSAREARSQPQE